MYDVIVKNIVKTQGGYREKEILKNPHMIEKSETWNNFHKVLNITEQNPQKDGYRNGFQIDLITKSICG